MYLFILSGVKDDIEEGMLSVKDSFLRNEVFVAEDVKSFPVKQIIMMQN